ncbi:hypothetical protein BCR32DRAFT_250649 [Anaeromyces robustus]|uniref:Uncharacterized protein n=1 Tax=Anaeromyces robustus TaxID=1754192 RepID=A0A1Y1VXF9_9FUNG|nr:hypothetical protein BCR32DRAFT_250649 [Anaeromyces robustus]|eukprot:ORX65464.1 hypothetical protein BCR32DRAFT_250649 [Anaeromyces robustus]
MDNLELNMNIQHCRKVLNENNYEISENFESLKVTEKQRNIFKLEYICPLVYILDYKDPNITENIIISYIWSKFQKSQNYQYNKNINPDDPQYIVNQWIDFNNKVHKYFWYNDIIKYL